MTTFGLLLNTTLEATQLTFSNLMTAAVILTADHSALTIRNFTQDQVTYTPGTKVYNALELYACVLNFDGGNVTTNNFLFLFAALSSNLTLTNINFRIS
jgi:hypothetical protein